MNIFQDPKRTGQAKIRKMVAKKKTNAYRKRRELQDMSCSFIMSEIKQENVPKLKCPNSQEKLASPDFLTMESESQLRSAFQFDRAQEERQNLPYTKIRHKRAKHIRTNKACQAELLETKCQEVKPSIPGLDIHAVVKKTVDYKTQLSGTEVKCIQYGNTSYTSDNTDHPDWAAGHCSLLAYQTGIYRAKDKKITQVLFLFYLILI